MSATRRRRAVVPKELKGPQGIEAQPVHEIHWIERERILANDYNPNVVPPPEMRLLKVSLLADGWTQPLVVRLSGCLNDTNGDGDCAVCAKGGDCGARTFELVDGFHRWLAAEDKRITKMTGGLLPCTVLPEKERGERMMSTVRHNRARGEHQVLKMAEIVNELADERPDEEIEDLLQMEPEEVSRLKDRGDMRKRGAGDEFGKGWTPQ